MNTNPAAHETYEEPSWASAYAEAQATDERHLRENALAFLQEAHGGVDDAPAPVFVCHIFEAFVSSGRTTVSRLKAIVVCEDGTARVVAATVSCFLGSWNDPPEGDADYESGGPLPNPDYSEVAW